MFKRGDLVDINKGAFQENRAYFSLLLKDKKTLIINNKSGVRFIVLRKIDEESVLVTFCIYRKTNGCNPLYNYKIADGFYASTDRFYAIHQQYLHLSEVPPLKDPKQAVSSIYEIHNKEIIKEKREIPLRQKYKIAVMTNNRAAMRKIEEQLGYAPVGTNTTENTKVKLKCTSNKCYQGGSFSPR